MGDANVGAAWPAPPRYYKEPLRAPPEPPPDGESFQMFGVMRPALGALPELPVLEEQLFSLSVEADAVPELRRLNRELLRRFLALLRTAQEKPSQCAAQVSQIRALMYNMIHLLNTLRAYQAREELIEVVQAQVDTKKRLVQKLKDATAAAVACTMTRT